jgi:predicted PolB exonuclease-like 3'-5' exonuclease
MVNSSSISAQILARRTERPAAASGPATAFLVVDTESVPNGDLIRRVKYPDEPLTADEAVARARQEAREASRDGSDFLPVTFQIPVAVCVLRVGVDLAPLQITALDAPHFRRDKIVSGFWAGVAHYDRARLVTFNGRGFDMPLLEMAAFDRGLPARSYFAGSRNRFQGNHLDLMDFLSNYGACRLAGGLNMLAKRIGKPGKMGVDGDQVYALWREGRLAEINDYCLCDTLDTYFVFLRTRVLLGEMTLLDERRLVERARCWIAGKAATTPALGRYLRHWRADGPQAATGPVLSRFPEVG